MPDVHPNLLKWLQIAVYIIVICGHIVCSVLKAKALRKRGEAEAARANYWKSKQPGD